MTKSTTLNASNTTASAEPDVDTLFDQALAASLQRQSEVAVAILNTVLMRNPYHANARHLLGAEYAQAGKINEAVIEIATALELNPNLPLARFQLGLLLMTCARVEDAVQVWNGLDILGSEHVLNRFRYSMLLIAKGEMDQARQQLAATIAENIDLPALNSEMLVVIETIAASTSRQRPEANEDDPNSPHFLVSTYVQSPTIH